MRRHAYIILSALILSLILAISLTARQRGIRVTAKSGDVLYLYKDYHALVVGVGDYASGTGWPDLPGALKDAKGVAGELKALGFKVKLLINPTSKKLRSTLKKLPYREGREKNRALLLYFSGHGETLTLADGTELGYLIPVDCPTKERDEMGFTEKAVSMKEVESVALMVKSKHFLTVFDSCFSGSIFTLVKAAPRDISEKSARPVRQFITAGEAGEQVPDKSIFKIVFLDGIKGDADLNEDGFVTGSELGMHLQDKVVNYTSGGQHPQYGKIRNPKLDKGDFIFALKAPAKTKVPEITAPPAPPKPAGIGDYDAVIRERAAAEKKWADWQGRMDSDYTKAEGYDKSSRLKAKEKARVWSNFLSSYGTDNPYSSRDEELRQKAQQRRDHWKKYKKVAMGKAPTDLYGVKTFTNSIGMKFVKIPAGSFMMGSPSSEPGRDSDERQHRVTISKPFYMATTEVTQGQWKRVMGSNPSKFRSGDNYPVEQVSWDDAQEFIRKLNRKEGTDKYRLPTEAQWEYACRAGTTTVYSWGNDEDCSKAMYWNTVVSAFHDGCAKYVRRRGLTSESTAPVMSYPPNHWGLYDMHGNVWEWVQDRYGDYPSGSVTDPKGPSNGGGRVIRGGSWWYPPLSSADRRSFVSFLPNFSGDPFGFRVSRGL